MDELPKLPGFSFEDRYKTNYGIPKTFEIINGYNIPLKLQKQIGDDLPAHKTVSSIEKVDSITYDPLLTYGRVRQQQIEPFRPKFVIYDKMALTFNGFFKQCVPDSSDEHFRIRHVNIIYFLEDDTIKIMEPKTNNSGLHHGLLVRRSKIAKNQIGEIYTWKDFNIGIDIEINGIVFHITDCDQFTKDFLISEGVELNDAELSPIDPVACEKTINRLIGNRLPSKTNLSKIQDDKLRRFLEFQGKILRFDCVLEEQGISKMSSVKPHQLFYFLEDDTVLIRKSVLENELHQNSVLLKRTKLPKNWTKKPKDFPSIYMELNDNEIEEYYQPKDFRIGETIFVFGRRFLLLDCDKFTRNYYENVLKMKQGDPLKIEHQKKPQSKREIPDYLGLGSPEDSLGSFYALRPKPPKKDILKYIVYANKFLRYGCILDSVRVEDKERKFVINYSLADDKISIVELPVNNSGIIGGKFLNSQRIMLPNCNKNEPKYYEPKHFYIGATLEINSRRFKITTVDYYVYKYMKQNPEYFSPEIIKNVQKYLLLEGHLKEDIRDAILKDVEDEEENSKLNNMKIDQKQISPETVIKHSDVNNIKENCLQDTNNNNNVKKTHEN